MGAPLVGRPEAYVRIADDFFDEEGGIASERTREFLAGFLRGLHDLIARWVPTDGR